MRDKKYFAKSVGSFLPEDGGLSDANTLLLQGLNDGFQS